MFVMLSSQRIHQINLIFFIFIVLYNESILEQHVFLIWDLKQNILKWVHFQWDQNQYPTIGPQIEFTYHNLEWDNSVPSLYNRSKPCLTTEDNCSRNKATNKNIHVRVQYVQICFLRGEIVLPLYL